LSEVLPLPEKIKQPKHHAALPFAELPAFMGALRQRQGVAARALEFTVLTAARTGEVIGACWDELDLDAKTWVIPAGRMKAGKQHSVPLSDAALDILRVLPREKDNEFVFIGGQRGGGMSNMAMAAVLKRLKRSDITVHGFRSCFSDWAHEQTAYPAHIIEMAMAHAVGGVAAAYRRGELLDKRRRLMADWARYCYSVPSEGKVLSLREAAR
jgi:integrase